MKHVNHNRLAYLILGAIVLCAGLGLGGYSYAKLRQENQTLLASLNETKDALTNTQNQNIDLQTKLDASQATVDFFQNQINGISSTVGTLEKLKNTDPELLAKYSKIYFLNENYIPASLTDINPDFAYSTKTLQILTKVEPYLEHMLEDAKAAGLNLEVISAYRSFGEQGGLKSAYSVTYGSGANTFSADQGYSEHQLGTAVDFTTPKVGNTFSGFSKTDEYTWLKNNAYKYGFILSYPEDNSYYIFEPWHWRFVGTSLALTLHEEGKNFYDLDQREIDHYLINIFG